MNFSDAEFALVRISSARLTGEVNALNAEAARIKSFGSSPEITAQLQSLTAQRETAINAEVAYLKQSLPAAKIGAFELFLKAFFHQPNATDSASSAAQATRSGVQQ